jgi:4-amino-4-deoxy-L-arabinose transferase-like glycosyltransferase
MTKKLTFWILGLILVLAAGVRVWQLDKIPDGFDGDEAALGYLAWSIGEEGTDEYGNKVPLYFESIGDYKYPAYIYLTVPIVKLLGLKIASARLLSALAGVGIVGMLFLVIKEMFDSREWALVAAGIATISPWLITYSRGAYEANLGVFLAMVVIWGWIRWLNREHLNKWEWGLWGLSFLGAMFSYSAIRLFLGLWLLVLTVGWKAGNLRKGWRPLVAAAILVGVSGGLFLSFGGQARARGLLLTPAAVETTRLEDDIREDGLVGTMPVLLTRMFHNKVINYVSVVFGKYVGHFDPEFLFVEGDNRPLFKSPNYGLLYAVELPLIVLGWIWLLKKYPGRAWIPAGWILLGAGPSTLTVESRNAIRFLVAAPVLVMLSAAGVMWVVNWLKEVGVKPVISGIGVGLVMAYGALGFGHDQVVHRTYHDPWFRDGGMREMVEKVTKLKGNYKKVLIPGDPYIFFLFFNRVKPSEFLLEATLLPKEENQWDRVSSWGKINFGMPVDCPKVGKLGGLYVCKGVEVPINSRVVDGVYFRDGVPAFTLLEFVPLSSVERPLPKLPSRLNYMVEADSRNDGLIPADEDRWW